MSETDRPQPHDPATAPNGVTDPLLWRLAVGVVEAHHPDENGRCDNLFCAGEEWPCAASVNAQRALAVAGVTSGAGTPHERDADRWDGSAPTSGPDHVTAPGLSRAPSGTSAEAA